MNKKRGKGYSHGNPGRMEFVTKLENVQLFFYETVVPVMRDGKMVQENTVLADYNHVTEKGDTVAVTVFPKKFQPKLWSPNLGVENRKVYTLDLRIMANRFEYIGYGEPAKGTMLTDDEILPIVRVIGSATGNVAFKIRGQWRDGSP